MFIKTMYFYVAINDDFEPVNLHVRPQAKIIVQIFGGFTIPRQC